MVVVVEVGPPPKRPVDGWRYVIVGRAKSVRIASAPPSAIRIPVTLTAYRTPNREPMNGTVASVPGASKSSRPKCRYDLAPISSALSKIHRSAIGARIPTKPLLKVNS